MKKIFTVKRAILVLILAAAAFTVFRFVTRDNNPVSYITEDVKTGTIRKVVNATGEVGAQNLVSVGAQVSGQIEKLYVELGQAVKKGDMIAQIDSTTQQNELDINKSQLQSYIAQLASAQVALNIAQIQYEREKRLAGNDATSQVNLENMENTYASAKSTVANLMSQVKQAQISVNTSETNLGYTKIVAPFDGTVVSIPTKEGQTVNANQTTPTIVQLADLSMMEILIQVSEGDITKVKPGMKVTYTVLSEPGRVYSGELKSLDPGLTTLSDGTYTGVIDQSTAIYYYGRIPAVNTDGNLRIGMTTQSSITISSAENVLTIPSITITDRGGKKYVQVLNGNIAEERGIVTGLSDNLNTEVKSGLKAGEKVVSGQMTAGEISRSAGNIRMPRM